MSGNLADAIKEKTSTLPTKDPKADQEKPNPLQLLQKFLDENNLELRLTPPNVRPMQDGGLLLDPPQIVVSYKRPVGKLPPTSPKNG